MDHLTAETRLNSRGYSGSLDLLALDLLVLSQNAATQGDGAGYGSQIYQEPGI